MRKLLLASVATLGASMGMAYAQDTTAPAAPAPPAPVMSTTLTPQAPTPGNIVIHLNGRVNFYFGEWANYNAGRPSVGPNTGAKLQSTGAFGYARLYPGFDGIAANGLKYGAAIEIWNDPGFNNEFGPDTRSTLFIRRTYGYIGTDQLGTMRFGYADGPGSLFLTGSMESFNDGGWDGDVPFVLAGSNIPLWPVWGDYGGVYTTGKVVYLSPQFAGFDFGVGFEPGTGGQSDASGCQGGVASPSCDALSSSSAAIASVNGGPSGAAALNRRRNTVDVAARYRGTFGAVGLAAYANYWGGGRVTDNTDPTLGLQGTYNTYKPLSAGAGGAQVTFAGLTVGGWVGGGQLNNVTGLQPDGGKSSLSYIVGAQYVTGPVTIGFHWFDSWFAGNYGAAGTALNGTAITTTSGENDYGVAAGGTYALAPGVSLYLSYLYGKRRQVGFDFIQGTAGQLNNVVQAQAIALGTQFNW